MRKQIRRVYLSDYGEYGKVKQIMLNRCIDLSRYCVENDCTFNEIILSVYIQGLSDGYQCNHRKVDSFSDGAGI